MPSRRIAMNPVMDKKLAMAVTSYKRRVRLSDRALNQGQAGLTKVQSRISGTSIPDPANPHGAPIRKAGQRRKFKEKP